MPTDKERLDWLEKNVNYVELATDNHLYWIGMAVESREFTDTSFRAALDQAMKEFP